MGPHAIVIIVIFSPPPESLDRFDFWIQPFACPRWASAGLTGSGQRKRTELLEDGLVLANLPRGVVVPGWYIFRLSRLKIYVSFPRDSNVTPLSTHLVMACSIAFNLIEIWQGRGRVDPGPFQAF